MKTYCSLLNGVADEAPHLVPPVTSVLPFLDLFNDEGEVLYDDDGDVYYGLECDYPLPDEDGSLPHMHWSAGIYADRVELFRLRKYGSVSRILSTETLSLRKFWGLLRRYGATTSA